MLRVGELWREVLPSGTRLLAGEAGLDREVTWPARLRSRPPAFGQLKGGEVALVGLQTLQQLDPALGLARVLRQVQRAGVVAAVVNGEPPADALAAADELGLPLFVVPADALLADLERTITQQVLERRADLQRRAREVERELMELAIEGQGVAAIVARLSQALGRSAWLLASDGCALAKQDGYAGGVALADATARELVHSLAGRLDSTRLRAADPPALAVAVGGRAFLAAPVVRDGKPCAYLALDGAGTPSPLERTATARAAAACAVELARSQAVLAAQQSLVTEPMLAVLDETLPAEVAAARAAHAGLDLAAVWVVGVVESAGDAPLEPDALAALRAAVGRGSVWAWRAAQMVALLPPAVAEDTRLHGIVEAALDGQRVSLGLGRPYTGVAGLRASYHEAVWALRLSLLLQGSGAATAFATLGVHRLLYRPEHADEIRDFAAALLGTLQRHDAEHGSELVHTLDTYLRSGGSPTETASRLGLHRNTVLYRLQRITAIADVDLGDAERCLELYLALRADEVLRALGGARP